MCSSVGLVIGIMILILGTCIQMQGAVYFFLLSFPFGLYMFISKLLYSPIIGIIITFILIIVSISCWGLLGLSSVPDNFFPPDFPSSNSDGYKPIIDSDKYAW